MSTNAELAALFDRMAGLLELTGANRFRIAAHQRVARILEGLSTDVAILVDEPSRLTDIEGIGEGSAKKIIEYVQTGRICELDELQEKVPSGLLEVMAIPGLGPKTVKLMWENAGITDIASLKKALDDGTVADLPRMGEKTIANIREALAFTEKSGGRIRLGEALPIAEELVESLGKIKGVKRIEYAGSLRRGKETIGDIDLLAVADDADHLSEHFRSMDGVSKVLASGATKSSVRLARGVQVDLRIVDASSFGAALMYFTGSKEHNVVMRERAIRMGYRLNEYGLYPHDDDDTPPQQRGVRPVAGRTEKEIYSQLKFPYIEPELRENRGEFDRDLPALIEVSDIKAELHAHTVASDGTLSTEELANEAKRRGFHTIAVTDHSRSSVQANGLSPERLRDHIESIRKVNEKIKGMTVLAGSEVDIHADGTLDYEDDLLAELDVVIASPHASLRQKPDIATKRLVAAVAHPLVHVLGHPTGRMINSREGLSPDIDAIIEAAIEHDTALELNANPMRLDMRDTHVRAAVEAGALIAINTDAHSAGHFDFLRYGIMTGRRGWLTADQCINAWSGTKLSRWLKKKR